MECCSFNASVGDVAFFQDEMVNPVTGHLLALKTFHKFQKTVFELKRQCVQQIEVRRLKLPCFMISNESGNRLAK